MPRNVGRPPNLNQLLIAAAAKAHRILKARFPNDGPGALAVFGYDRPGNCYALSLIVAQVFARLGFDCDLCVGYADARDLKRRRTWTRRVGHAWISCKHGKRSVRYDPKTKVYGEVQYRNYKVEVPQGLLSEGDALLRDLHIENAPLTYDDYKDIAYEIEEWLRPHVKGVTSLRAGKPHSIL